MNETIATGDLVSLADGTQCTVKAFEMFAGLYVLDLNGVTIAARRYDFAPVNWVGDVVGKTGLGCCAAGAEGQGQ